MSKLKKFERFTNESTSNQENEIVGEIKWFHVDYKLPDPEDWDPNLTEDVLLADNETPLQIEIARYHFDKKIWRDKDGYTYNPNYWAYMPKNPNRK